MVVVDGWIDWAKRVPPPKILVWGWNNPNDGAVLHSAVGNFNGQTPSTLSSVSWHLSVCKTGELWQHYPLNAQCWHGGNSYYNHYTIGIEHEGGGPRWQGDEGNFGEPLTQAQINTDVRLLKEISMAGSWVPRRAEPRTLYEHNERQATACPSGRIPWWMLLDALNEEPLPSEGEDSMDYISGSHEHEWWRDRPFDVGSYAFEARDNLKLAPETRIARVYMELDSGKVAFRNPDGHVAGYVWPPGGHVDVYLKADGWIDFEVTIPALTKSLVRTGWK
jgi:hypothetical protein